MNPEQLVLWGHPQQPRSRDARVPEREQRWSGPLQGQTALPPTGTDNESILASGEGGPLGADAHGNFDEYGGVHPWDPMGDIESAYSISPKLQAHAQRQPVQMMRTDTAVHTLQGVSETEDLYDEVHGPMKRRQLERNVAATGMIRQPLPIVHHQGRHILLDGHHRLLAARKAGLSHVPVQIFDHDAHVARGGQPMIEMDQDADFGWSDQGTSDW